jgi:hypothetical protein
MCVVQTSDEIQNPIASIHSPLHMLATLCSAAHPSTAPPAARAGSPGLCAAAALNPFASASASATGAAACAATGAAACASTGAAACASTGAAACASTGAAACAATGAAACASTGAAACASTGAAACAATGAAACSSTGAAACASTAPLAPRPGAAFWADVHPSGLLIDNVWCDLLLSGRKTVELRCERLAKLDANPLGITVALIVTKTSHPQHKRTMNGLVRFCASTELEKCTPDALQTILKAAALLPDDYQSEWQHAWSVAAHVRFEKPFECDDGRGAQKWVRLSAGNLSRINLEARCHSCRSLIKDCNC